MHAGHIAHCMLWGCGPRLRVCCVLFAHMQDLPPGSVEYNNWALALQVQPAQVSRAGVPAGGLQGVAGTVAVAPGFCPAASCRAPAARACQRAVPAACLPACPRRHTTTHTHAHTHTLHGPAERRRGADRGARGVLGGAAGGHEDGGGRGCERGRLPQQPGSGRRGQVAAGSSPRPQQGGRPGAGPDPPQRAAEKRRCPAGGRSGKGGERGMLARSSCQQRRPGRCCILPRPHPSSGEALS